MPLTVKLETRGLKRAAAGLRKLAGEQEKIAVAAVNEAAFVARKRLIAEAALVFEAPRPFVTKSSWIVLKARPGGGKRSAALVVPRNTPGAKPQRRHGIFETQIEGGIRGIKPFEAALANAGRGLPRGSILVPTRELRLDASGNIPRRRLAALIAGARDGSVWIGPLGRNRNGPVGVWERKRRGGRGRPQLRLLLRAIPLRSVRYRPRFRLGPALDEARTTFTSSARRRTEEAARAAFSGGGATSSGPRQ